MHLLTSLSAVTRHTSGGIGVNMPKYFKAGRDIKLRQLTSPESCLANDIGRMTWYHNTNRLATAHSLGMMPDYMRGRTCFNQITALVKVKWLDSSDQYPQEKIKDTNTTWDVCLAMPTPRQLGLPAGLEKVDPSTLFGGSFGHISNKINVRRFSSLWATQDDEYKGPPVYFHNQTGLMEFEGLDFNLQSPPQEHEWGYISNPNFIEDKLDQRERELWDEFREWRAKYENSAFIPDVWEPLENMRGGKFGVLKKKYIPGIVSTAIKRHYKLIALFRHVSRCMKEELDADDLVDGRFDHSLDPFGVIKARLGAVTGFDSFRPFDMIILDKLLSRWREYIPEIQERMDKLVEDYCPKAPQIAQFLLERHEGIKVTLDDENFCPFQYFDEAKEDPYPHSAAGGGMKESSDSEDQMDEDLMVGADENTRRAWG